MKNTIRIRVAKDKLEKAKEESCTQKQVELIHEIEEAMEMEENKKFHGTSKNEASIWLAKYADLYRNMKKRKKVA